MQDKKPNQKPDKKNIAKRTADVYERAIREAIDRQLTSISYSQINNKSELN